MTQFIEPNKKSDLVAPRVLDWLQSMRSGLLEGFEVTAVAGTQLINIASGRVVIGGTTIWDDLTRNNSTIIQTAGVGSPAAGNTHVMIYAKYTYADTFPPASMDIEAIYTEAADPATPASPSLPADSVKLADIFIAQGQTNLDNAQIINAPKMPDRGQNDGDVLIERLINSNYNTVFGGGGAILYTGNPTYQLSWTQDMIFYAPTVTHQEKFFTAPLAVGEVPAGDSPLSGVGDNCIIFTIFDRTSVADPSTPVPLTLYALDLDNPDPTARNLFFNPNTRDRIVFVAMIIGGVLRVRSSMGSSLPPPDASADKFLRNDPGGAHYWSLITEDLIQSILSISNFVCTTSPVELGDIVNNPAFTATVINDDGDGPDTAQLTNDDNGEDKDVVSGFGGTSSGAFVSDITGYQKSTPGANGKVIFTLTADDGATPDVANVDLDWWRYTYCGFAAVDPGPGGYNLAWLQALTDSYQLLREGRTFASGLRTPTGSQYFFFAYPAWKGAITAILDNISGFDVLAAYTERSTTDAVVTENAAAISENYRVWRTNNLQSGPVNITVS